MSYHASIYHFLLQSVNNIDYPIMTTINHSSYEIN